MAYTWLRNDLLASLFGSIYPDSWIMERSRQEDNVKSVCCVLGQNVSVWLVVLTSFGSRSTTPDYHTVSL